MLTHPFVVYHSLIGLSMCH